MLFAHMQVKKFLLVVQLLLGEVPERSVFQHEDFKLQLKPYFALTQVPVVSSTHVMSLQ